MTKISKRYLEDFDDLSVALARLRDSADPVLDWDEVRDELLPRTGPFDTTSDCKYNT